MANPKSKSPTSLQTNSPVFNHSPVTGVRDNPALRRSQSQRSRVNDTQNDGRSLVRRTQSLLVRTDTPVPGTLHGYKPRKLSYKISYDPTREPGNEYQIEKRSVSEYDVHDDDDARSNDSLTIGTDEVSLPVEIDDQSTQYHGDRVESAELEGADYDPEKHVDETDNAGPSKAAVTPPESPLDVIDSRAHTIHSQENRNKSPNENESKGNDGEVTQNNERDDTPVPDAFYIPPLSRTIEKDLTIQSIETLQTNKSRTPKPLTPTDRGETNILFKDINGHSQTASVSSSIHLTPANGDNGVPSRAITRQADSIPPPNFKLNLFNRIKRISTPKRLAKINGFLNRTSEKGKGVSIKPNQSDNNATSANAISLRVPNAGISHVKPHESTFVKDSKRFERMSSTDSIRTHYDKGRRKREIPRKIRSRERYESVEVNKENKENIEIKRTTGPKNNEMSSIRQIVSKRKEAQKQTNVSNLEDKAEHNSGTSKKRAIDSAGVDITTEEKATLAKRRLTGAKPITRTGLFTDRNFGRNLDVRSPRTVRSGNIDSDDVFTEDEKKARLRKAQYLNDDLKLVKRKVKTVEDRTRPKSLVTPGEVENIIQRKNILSNVNRNQFKKAKDVQNSHPEAESQNQSTITDMPMAAQSTRIARGQGYKAVNTQANTNTKSEKVFKGGRTFPKEQGKQIGPNKAHNGVDKTAVNKSTDIFNKALNRKRKPSISFKDVKNEGTNPKVLVHPKIHKIRSRNETQSTTSDHQGHSMLSQTESNSQTNVVNWLMNSVSDDVSHGTGTTKVLTNTTASPKRSVLSKRWTKVPGKPKLIVRKPNRLQKKKSFVANINKGFYMPLPKPSQRMLKRWNHLFTQVGKSKGYESEIPILHSDDEVYPEARPLTDTAKYRFPITKRYEGENVSFGLFYNDVAHTKVGPSKGALVLFYRNGDPNDRGYSCTINKYFKNFEQLLIHLSGKISTPTGVHHIFELSKGMEIKSLTQFRNRCVYVAASKNKLKMVKYGESRENFWSNKKPSAGKMRSDERELFKNKKPAGPNDSPPKDTPHIVTIVSNLNRERKEKMILNPRIQQSFEDWLQDINSPGIPVRAIYTKKPPHVQVNSFSHLFRELKQQNHFIACGDEYLPLEITKKRPAPSSNSSTDSISESRSRKKKLPRQQEMGQIHESFENRPMSTALSRFDNGPYGPRFNPFPGRGPARAIDSRRKDFVEIEIDGVLREFIPPSYFEPDDDGAKPDRFLNPEWVYGFRGRDARQNIIVYHETDEVVYYVAAVVVLYNKEKDTQRHYIKHNEEITSIAIHPGQLLIATGQLQGRDPEHGAHIRIWHGVTLSTYSVIGLGVFSVGITSIGFSQDDKGMYLCALDMSEKHVLSVWDWQCERVLARTSMIVEIIEGKGDIAQTTPDPVHNACFYPDGHNTSILITYGTKHIFFWKIFFDAVRRKEAKILRDRNSGIFEDDIPGSINCIAWLPTGDIVTGDTNGNLMVWERDPTDAFTCKMVVPAHTTTIMSLCLLDDGTLLSGAGTEIKAWDTELNFTCVKTRQIPDSAGHIRSIATQKKGGNDGRLYVGTVNSAILDGSLQQKFRYIVQGHGQGVWGVVPHPFEPTFISAGQDQVVFKWSLVTHKLIWRSHIEAPSTCVAVDHRHELIAVGTGKGLLIFLNGYNGMHIATVEVGTESIGCLSFSRDCLLLAMGCDDGTITVFEMLDRGHLFKSSHVTHTCHKSGVAHLDWSTDSRCIQSTDYNHDLIFWNVDTMQQIEITRLVRDVDWYTATCDVAYYMIGPWSNMDRGENIRAACRSNGRDMLLVGDTMGRLRLYKFPCSKEKADFRGVRVYSSGVTAIAFTPDSRSALTSGGNDAALIQWSVADDGFI